MNRPQSNMIPAPPLSSAGLGGAGRLNHLGEANDMIAKTPYKPIFAFLLLATMAGCQSPRQTYLSTLSTHEAVVTTLVELRDQMLLGDDEWKIVQDVDAKLKILFDVWDKRVDADESGAVQPENIARLMSEILVVYIRITGDGK